MYRLQRLFFSLPPSLRSLRAARRAAPTAKESIWLTRKSAAYHLTFHLSSSKKHAERFLLAYFFALLLTESQSYFLVSGDLFPVCGHTHHVEEIGHWDFAVLFGGMIEQLGKLSLKCQKILMGEQIPKSENHRKVVTLSVNVLLPVFRNRELLMEWQIGNVMLGAAMGEKPFVVGAYVSKICQNL